MYKSQLDQRKFLAAYNFTRPCPESLAGACTAVSILDPVADLENVDLVQFFTTEVF